MAQQNQRCSYKCTLAQIHACNENQEFGAKWACTQLVRVATRKTKKKRKQSNGVKCNSPTAFELPLTATKWLSAKYISAKNINITMICFQ